MCPSRTGDALDIGDELHDVGLRYLAGIGGHHRVVACDDLRLRQQDGIAQIVVVGNDRLASRKGHRVPIQAFEARRAHRRIGAVAAVAAERAITLGAARRHAGRLLLSREPPLVIRRVEDDDAAQHARMIRAAVFGAEEVVVAGPRGGEPEHAIASGQDILLDAKLGHEEAVDHVLRCHDHLDGNADGNVQLVDLPCTGRMVDAPHPLLCNDGNFHRVGRRRRAVEIERGSPGERGHEQQQRYANPRDLDAPLNAPPHRRVGAPATGAVPPAVADDEDHHDDHHADCHRRRERGDRDEEVIDAAGERRCGHG